MPPSVHIDAMRDGDLCAVAAIDGATRMDEAQLKEELGRPWARLWVAREENGEVAAFLVSWHVADELHVLNVATREDRRRRGIGRALMDVVVGYARSHHVKHVLLEVRRSNAPAIALYRCVGFFAMGVRARYYPDDEDAVEMVLMLDPDTGAVVAHADEVRLDGS
ncbi:MAG TPA: ribosomal protein S18-alanine N-acetyltransferase [Polyangiaceae bacterium]|jgi:ribosomal-protein-alanine N-acetyltransferase